MTKVYFDFETRSAVDLRDVGAFRYAEDPTTEALCMGYAIDEGPVQLWRRGEPAPEFPVDAIFVAHNIQFDALIFEKTFKRPLAPTHMIDTLAQCHVCSIPASLAKAAAFLKLPYQKDTKGKVLLGKLSRPLQLNPLTWYEKGEVLDQLYSYCRQDVETLRALHKALPELSPAEKKVWEEDWKINAAGLAIDVDFVTAAISVVAENKVHLDHEMRAITGGIVNACSEVKKLTEWAQANGSTVTSLAKQPLVDALAGEMSPTVRRALTLRQQYAKSSTAKLVAVVDGLCADGRLRGQFVYHGAGTGRWSGRHAQLQNLPRLKVDADTAEQIIAAVKTKDLTTMGSSVLDAVSGVLRGIIVAGENRMLVGADLSSIEARIVAWLAGQNDVLEVFRRNEDVYCYTAQRIYGRTIDKEKDKTERFIGKVAQLALGYEGGVGSFIRMASNYGIVIPDDKAKEVVTKWREANPLITWYWRDIETAAMDAIAWPHKAIPCGKVGRKIHFKYDDPFLKCRLPSGRVLYYPHPVVEKVVKFGKTKKALRYIGEIPGKTGVFPIDMYGGKWTENVTQAIARDVMAEGMLRVAEKHQVIGTVHDELIVEADPAVDSIVAEMTITPTWAPGLPLGAEGWKRARYLKK